MIELGQFSVFFALVVSAWAVTAAILGAIARGRGLQRSAENGLLAGAGLIGIATACLLHGFLTDDFRIDYVYHYSSTSQPLSYKIGALWGGQAGSLLLWVLILGVMAAVVVLTNRNKNRALMPWVTAIVGTVMVFFLMLLNFVEPPFALGPMRPDGVGLNPQLKNYWMMIHPPSLYLGYVGFTIPFAFGIAALATRRTGDIWIRTTRRWTLFSWFFLGIGILLGSYWAWDPVENASLMPWLVGTAFLHSVMIQEKKGMLKVWNMSLVILTFTLSIFGTFLTRSGIISSVHSFATSQIGPWFAVFLGLVFFGSLALLILRLPDLKTEARLESVMSRESSFLFNNMIFVGIAASVLLLTTFPMISEAVTGRKVTMGPPIFNLVNVPWAIFLLLLTGVGPLIAWRRASSKNLKRNFLIPGLTGVWTLLALLMIDLRAYGSALAGVGRAIGGGDVMGMFEQLNVFYPALTFGAGAFVLATMGLEFWRGTRARMRQQGEPAPLALGTLIWRNKRRYGGYVVHIGVVLVFFGIAGSAAYQKEDVRLLEPGGTLEIDGYVMRYDGYRLEAVDDHIGAVTELTLLRSGRELGRIEAEQRFHPNLMFPELRQAFLSAKAQRTRDPEGHHESVKGLYALIRNLENRVRREVKTPSTEVGIHASLSPLSPSTLGEDFYVIPLSVDPATGQTNFRVFINPMVNFIWLGGLIFVLGAHLSVLPDRRERRRLEAALELEEQERAVA